MLGPFFQLAGRSVSRQATFRQLLVLHQLALGAIVCLAMLAVRGHRWPDLPDKVYEMTGHALVIAGIVEGALLLGWRLTQWPKSQAIEPLLLSPVPAWVSMVGEQAVGATYLLFISLSSVPLLAGLVGLGWLDPLEAALLPASGFLFGCVTGLGLTWWAYEPKGVRRVGEVVALVGLLTYLIVGALAAEKLPLLLAALPPEVGYYLREGILWSLFENPFALVTRISRSNEWDLWIPVARTHAIAAAAVLFFTLRAAARLKGHYTDRHYRPVSEVQVKGRGRIADAPLSWWAVKRVNEYPGRTNLYLAVGAAVVYGTFVLLDRGGSWPPWLGRNVYEVFNNLGGISGFTTMLACLTAVPAAYQYGLWDSSIPERVKRLEAFLLTYLEPIDYLRASAAASWSRSQGFVWAAVGLWAVGWYAGLYDGLGFALAVLSGAAMSVFAMAVGFRCLAGGRGGPSVGFALTVVLPLVAWGLGSVGLPQVSMLLPAGMTFYATRPESQPLLIALAVAGYTALSAWLLRGALASFDRELRQWYDDNHGRKA